MTIKCLLALFGEPSLSASDHAILLQIHDALELYNRSVGLSSFWFKSKKEVNLERGYKRVWKIKLANL